MEYNSLDIETLLKDGQIQVSVLLTAIHVERALVMFIELYCKPKNARPLLEKMSFYQIIELSNALNVFKKPHWYGYFHDIRDVRNKIAHDFDYWKKLDEDKAERKKVEKICRNNLEFFEMSIPQMHRETNEIVSKNVKKMMKKAQESIRFIFPNVKKL